MNALPQPEMFRAIALNGCAPLLVKEDDRTGIKDSVSIFVVFGRVPVDGAPS